jgi:transcriptional regulator with XRE-family HTH domain
MEPTTVQRIANDLEAERERQGLTYYELAKRSGRQYQQGYVSQVLKGEKDNPSLAVVAQIAEALGMKVSLKKM